MHLNSVLTGAASLSTPIGHWHWALGVWLFFLFSSIGIGVLDVGGHAEEKKDIGPLDCARPAHNFWLQICERHGGREHCLARFFDPYARRDVELIVASSNDPPIVPWSGGVKPEGNFFSKYHSLFHRVQLVNGKVAVSCKGFVASGTGKSCYERVIVTYKTATNSSNALAHLRAQYKSLLWSDDVTPSASDLVESAAAAAVAADEAERFKCREKALAHRELFLSLLVGGCGLPESLCEAYCWRVFCPVPGHYAHWQHSSAANRYECHVGYRGTVASVSLSPAPQLVCRDAVFSALLAVICSPSEPPA